LLAPRGATTSGLVGWPVFDYKLCPSVGRPELAQAFGAICMKSPGLRHLSSAILVVAALGFGWTAATVNGQSGTPISPGGLDLKNTLEKGLKARRPVEFEFIARVVELVDEGTLPQGTVITSFLWARRHKPYPYPYFEFGLRNQAAKLNIQL
jgi:hypothetical protein